MIASVPQIREELARFADLGTSPPQEAGDDERFTFRLSREGESLELRFDDGVDGRVAEKSLDCSELRVHESYRALLASERFGDLRRWAGAQAASLQRTLHDIDRPIPVKGELSHENADMDVGQIDDFLASREDGDPLEGSVQILLIDGPAGIGKTKFIEFLALERAKRFTSTQRPLVLHVQSRGRVLTFLQDLIAFSLQTLRLRVTYDQLPVLVRHGLVSLAIDGFDELGDPSGYDLAWGQVNDLVNEVRGRGTLILAGRETFIGRERLMDSIKTLSAERDAIDVLSLKPPAPSVAKKWLKESERGWSDEDLAAVEELFEPDSYTLRPFFLAQLANREVAEVFRREALGYPLAFLVDLMIEREAGKFGEAIENSMDLEERKRFVRDFLREAARDMADQQSDVLDETGILWLVDVAVPEGAPSEVRNLLRNRANVMAFLTTDERPGYRRFAHSQLFNHFLSEVTLDVLARREVPKFIRRNILGADFLSAFSDLVPHMASSNEELVQRFFDAVRGLVHSYMWTDRGSRNMGALLLATLPAASGPDLRLEDLHVDEALLQGSASPADLVRVTVNQLDVRGADLSELRFTDSMIMTLIANDATRVSETFPDPSLIRYEGFGAEPSAVIGPPDEIRSWMDRHGRAPIQASQCHEGAIPVALRKHPIVRLLERACRVRSYWIRDDAEDQFNRFVRDPRWPALLALLKAHNLAKVRHPAASGPKDDFVHIVNAPGILQGLWEESSDTKIRDFHRALVRRIRDQETGG